MWLRAVTAIVEYFSALVSMKIHHSGLRVERLLGGIPLGYYTSTALVDQCYRTPTLSMVGKIDTWPLLSSRSPIWGANQSNYSI